MSIVFIFLGAWLIAAVLMTLALVAATRRPVAHCETSSLDTPVVPLPRERFGRSAHRPGRPTFNGDMDHPVLDV